MKQRDSRLLTSPMKRIDLYPYESLVSKKLGEKNTIGLEAMILSLVRLECAGKTGESFKTFIALYVIDFSNNLMEKVGGKKKLIFEEGSFA